MAHSIQLVQKIDERDGDKYIENIVWYIFYLKAFPEEKIETKAFRYTQEVDNSNL